MSTFAIFQLYLGVNKFYKLISSSVSECLCKPGYENTSCDILGMNNMKSGATGCNSCSQEKNKSSHVDPTKWKPLLLIIPLRLGLTDINAVYIDSLKV